MKRKKIIFFLIVIISQILYPIELPNLTGRVVDLVNVLKDSEKYNLEKRLEYYENKTGNQMVVCFIDTTNYDTIEEYSIRLAEKWKIGYKGKDNGIIMLFAMQDRKMRIEVGYGLEGSLTDLESKLLIEKVLVPHFRNSEYYEGIIKAIDYIEKETIQENDKRENIISKKFQQKGNKLLIKDKRLANAILIYFFLLGISLGILFMIPLGNRILEKFFFANLTINILYLLFFGIIYRISGISIIILFFINLLGFIIGVCIISFFLPNKGGSISSKGTTWDNYYYSNDSDDSNDYDSGSFSDFGGGFNGGGGNFGGGGASGSW